MFTDQIKLSPKRDSLSLRCIAEGIPSPSFQWTLDGSELRSSSHVRIETVPLPRLGVFSIVSYLNITSVRTQVSLNSSPPPFLLTLLGSQQNDSIVQIDSLAFVLLPK